MLRGLGRLCALTLVWVVVPLGLFEGALRVLDLGDPPVFRRDPDYGYLMAPNQSVSTRGYRFRINATGFRGRDLAVPKPDGLVRVAFVGESITYGGGSVREEDLFVDRVGDGLAALLGRKVEAINLSAPGWGVQNMAAYLEREGRHDADALVWVISAVDFRRDKESLARYEFPEGRLALRSLYFARLAYGSLRDMVLPRRPPRAASSGDVLERNLAALRRSLDESAHAGVRTAVVFVPTVRGYAPRPEDLTAYRSIAEAVGRPTLDLAPVLAAPDPARMFLDGVHLSSEGHAAAARALIPFVAQVLRGEPGVADHRAPAA